MNGKGFFAAVVRRRRRVLALYAAAAVLCALLSLLVSVNYDINDYLPPDAPSTVAIDVMEEAFGGGIPNVRAMVRDVTVPEALAYKQQIARVEGVTAVTWLDDVADVTVPPRDAGPPTPSQPTTRTGRPFSPSRYPTPSGPRRWPPSTPCWVTPGP